VLRYLFNTNKCIRVKERVREILEKDDAVLCGIVIVEILRGARDEKTFHLLKETLSLLHLDSDFETIASVCGVKQEKIV
jgi:predicted nucleic acid-binding protein